MKRQSIDRKLARAEARVRLDMLGAMSALMPDDRNSPGAPPPNGGGMRRYWSPAPRDVRTDTLPYLRADRGASRDLARTSPIAVGAINTNVDRVVGTGLALSCQPNRDVLRWSVKQALEWKRITQNEFSLWADSTDCDITQTQNFYQKQGLVLRGTLESGDLFTLMPDGQRTATQPYALRLQSLEADRIGNPSGGGDRPGMAGGVKTDENGAPIGYFVYTSHPGGYMPGQAGTLFDGTLVERLGRSGRRRILHHFRQLRPDQPRGLPYLQPIIDSIKQISRYTEAEIMAAVITSYFTVFIESPDGNSAPVFTGNESGSPTGGVGDELSLGMGAVVGLAPGEKVQTANPARPNPNFDPFIKSVIMQMGMALSLPYELLVKQFNASFSASKAALLDAWVYFRGVRTWLALSFCQPVYETWLAEAVAIGRIKAPGFFTDPLMRWAYTRAAWPGDSMGSIDPKKEVDAYVAAIGARLMTRERAEWELFGSDWNDTLHVKEAEEDALKDADLLPVAPAGAPAPAAAKPANVDPADPTDPADPAADPTDPLED